MRARWEQEVVGGDYRKRQLIENSLKERKSKTEKGAEKRFPNNKAKQEGPGAELLKNVNFGKAIGVAGRGEPPSDKIFRRRYEAPEMRGALKL